MSLASKIDVDELKKNLEKEIGICRGLLEGVKERLRPRTPIEII